MTGSGGSLLLMIFLFFGFARQKKNNQLLSQKNEEIQHEQERSEALLLNILPAQVAGELKQYGESKARRYDNVYVEIASQSLTGVRKIIERVDHDRILFGSDWPFYHQSMPLSKLLIATEGAPELRDKILYRNAARLLGLSTEKLLARRRAA